MTFAVMVLRDASERKQAEERLRRALEEVERLKQQLQAHSEYLQEEIQDVSEIAGASPALTRVLDEVARVAATDATVLVQGETGTGKELFARAIHAMSRRAERPLVRVNCGALPATLVASELFGHERGAFTGASSRRIGRFELAHGGTLFLDEVGELPLAAQAALLRALEEREFQRVGGERTLRVDVRVLAATNRDLPALVASGRFRKDLFYRLAVFPIALPPLRERRCDIPVLVQACLERLGRRLGRRLSGVSPASMERLLAYDWPGNVRELHNVLERAAIVSGGAWLQVEGLGAELGRTLARAPARAPEPESLAARERAHILETLSRTRWKIAGREGAAALLRIHPNTLRSRMQRLGIPLAREAHRHAPGSRAPRRRERRPPSNAPTRSDSTVRTP